MPKTTRSTNKKISTVITHNTSETNMSLDQQAQSSQTGNTSSNTSHISLPAHFANKLIGNGSSAGKWDGPKFKGNRELYPMFELKLKNYIALYDLETFLESDDVDNTKNLCLYHLIAQCLDDSPLHLVITQAKFDGRKAFKLLGEKYLGNFLARKIKALNELGALKQQPNESLTAYISRADALFLKLELFGVFNDSTFYVIKTLQGLLPKFDMFKAIINSDSKVPDWHDFKVRIQNHDQLQNATPETQETSIMHVATLNSPQINKKKKQSFNKFVKKPKSKCENCFSAEHNTNNCNSIKYCQQCQKSNHNTEDCRYISRGPGGRGRRSFGGGGSGSGVRGATRSANYRGAGMRGFRGNRHYRHQRPYNGARNRGRGHLQGHNSPYKNNYGNQYGHEQPQAYTSNYVNTHNDEPSMFA